MLARIRKLVPSPLKSFLRALTLGNIQALKWKYRLKHRGKNIILGKNIKINKPQFVSIGDNVVLANNISFYLNDTEDGIYIGNGTLINKWCDFGCSHRIEIKENCTLGPFVHITDRNHAYQDVNVPIKDQGDFSGGPVTINEDCWIGFGTQIMSGVTIGKHCVIGAGAIVTHDIPPFSVVVGNPAKVIKRYNFETKEWEKIKK